MARMALPERVFSISEAFIKGITAKNAFNRIILPQIRR
jgi:hypothetical protein